MNRRNVLWALLGGAPVLLGASFAAVRAGAVTKKVAREGELDCCPPDCCPPGCCEGGAAAKEKQAAAACCAPACCEPDCCSTEKK